ncbi:MAG: quinone-dependent dihydroorotate dehydrogenase [Bacteroidales bacterium]|nr:quinone-dependent dihydroorotate dehydrogenase [Bacteroidales bacterium]
MYRKILRPLLFTLKPETVHHIIVHLLKILFRLPLVSRLTSWVYDVNNPRLKRKFLGMTFKNPVGMAAGFDKNAKVFKEFSHFGFSFIEIGTVTPLAQPGNPKPRSFRLTKDQALINRMGFNNIGVDRVVKRLKNTHSGIVVGGNIGKNTETPNDESLNDYATAFNKIYNHVDYVVINLSCPNIKNLNELQDKNRTMEILNELMRIRSLHQEKKPLLLKISPDLDNKQLDDVMDIFYSTGIDAIIATNTTIQRKNLSTDSGKVKQIGDGGLSGKPLKQRSTEIIRYLNENSGGQIPIIGVGGIMSPEDALEKLSAGATLVQIYTGFIYNGPGLVKQINKSILRKTSGG